MHSDAKSSKQALLDGDADFKCIRWLSELTNGRGQGTSVHASECKPFLWRTVEEHDEWDEGKVGGG